MSHGCVAVVFIAGRSYEIRNGWEKKKRMDLLTSHIFIYIVLCYIFDFIYVLDILKGVYEDWIFGSVDEIGRENFDRKI